MERRAPLPSRRTRVRCCRALLLAALALFAAGCAEPVEPRWADTTSPESVATFDSPRQTLVFEIANDIGEIEFAGVVQAATSTQIAASADGRIVSNAAQSGDRVNAGEEVVGFAPTPSRAEELERELLVLQRELAIEQGSNEAIAQSDAAIEAFDAAILDLATVVESPVAGVVLDVTDGLTRTVSEGDALFSIATGNDVVIVIETTVERVEGLSPGDTVAIRTREVGALAEAATVSGIEQRDGSEQVSLVVEPVAPLQPETLGQTVEVSLDLSAEAERTWVDRRAVHRRDGDSFLLAETGDGQLQRLDVIFGRRTDTHVEVREVAVGRLAPGTVLVLP